MSQSKFLNITKSYIDELIKIYDKVCSLKENDYSGLLLLKKDFLNFYHKVQNYNIFSRTELEEDKLTFLGSSKIENFIKDHIFLEELVMMYFFTAAIEIIFGKIYKDFYYTKFFISHYKFLKRHGEKYQLISELENRPQEKRLTLSKAELEEIIKKEKNKFIELQNKLPREKLLLKKEINRLEGFLLPIIHEYRKIIAEKFFEIKEYFSWYNKDIRVYFSDTRDDLLITAYPSDTFKFLIYPRILSIFVVGCNLEEITSKVDFIYMFRGVRNKSFLKKTIHHLKIDGFNPFNEVLEIFWLNSNYDDKAVFVEKIFKLIGYKITKFDKYRHFYKLEKINLRIFNSNIKEDFNEVIIVALPDKAYLGDEDVNDYIKDIGNKIKNEDYKKCIIAKVDSSSEDLLTKAKINIISLNDIAKILSELEIFEFIKPFLIRNIKMKDAKLILQAQKNKEQGDNFKKKIFSFSESNWKAFEKLMEEIFKYLFKSSFKVYFAKPQFSEYEGHRKMDLVISNVNPIHEFWINRKKEEAAKRIIIDFKNYSRKITSSTIRSVTKYLHDKKGNFAIIMSKKGMDDSGIKEQRIRYYDKNQLIIVLDQNDIIEMINYKINNQYPEEILERKISLLI